MASNAPESKEDSAPEVPADARCCANCAKEGHHACSRCHVVRYCSRACQAAAWPAHKAVCAAPVVVTRAPKVVAPLSAAGGVMEEEHGRDFDMLVIMTRLFSNECQRITDREVGSLSRSVPADLMLSHRLSATAYSQWLMGQNGVGVLPRIREHISGLLGDSRRAGGAEGTATLRRLQADVTAGEAQFWGLHGKGRLYGLFWVVEQRPEGAVLVPDNDFVAIAATHSRSKVGVGKTAYLALGIAEPLTVPLLRARPPLALPALVRATLCAFRGRIVFDGTCVPAAAPEVALCASGLGGLPPAKRAARLAAAVSEAQAAGRLLSSFTARLPLEDISTAAEPGATLAAAPATAAEAAAAAALLALPPAPYLEHASGLLILRHLSTPEELARGEGDARVLVALGDGGGPLHTFASAARVAAAGELLQGAVEAARAAGGLRPLVLQADEAEALPRMRALLRRAAAAAAGAAAGASTASGSADAVTVMYYPLPSPEETALLEATRPGRR